jgi:hypothetical protein
MALAIILAAIALGIVSILFYLLKAIITGRWRYYKSKHRGIPNRKSQ